MNMQLDIPENYTIHKGSASTKMYQGTGDDLDYLQNPDLYSYAFIFGRNSWKNNFSFTLNMK